MTVQLTAHDVTQAIGELADPERAIHSQRFFKTGPGQYGAGDLFLGLTVPQQRKIAAEYKQLPVLECVELLHSPYHECRLTALFILVGLYKRGDAAEKLRVYKTYLANTQFINNWDLVDSSASYIVGEQLQGSDYAAVLVPLAHSENIWERRIAILSCFAFTMHGNPVPVFELSEFLLLDRHDLIHKAVGWMLREVGKRCSQDLLEQWLQEDKRYATMPRTMLRYAIERFPERLRQQYLRSAF